MQAVILCAGKSKRFYPFTNFGHKSMVPMMGKPLLQHTLESLKKAKFTSVIIVVSKDSPIPNLLQQVPGLSITYVYQEKALGMGNALIAAKDSLEENFFLLSGYHVDIKDFAHEMQKTQESSENIVLLAKEDTILERYGVLQVEGNKVVSLSEKPATSKDKGLRVISIYFLSKVFLTVLRDLPTEQYHFEKALDMYAKAGHVQYIQSDRPSLTLKYSWDLLAVKDYLLSQVKRSISKKASIAKSAIIQGDVIVADGVRILEGACVKGPCYLGENVVVGNNAILRNGVVVERDVVVGANMEVKNSLLMEHVTTHTGYIGDSVIGPFSRVAAGFCTANVRLDRGEIDANVQGVHVHTYLSHLGVAMGEKVDAGVGVSTMPGISIGNNATIGPGTIVMENVEENTLMYTKFQTVVKKSIRQTQDKK